MPTLEGYAVLFPGNGVAMLRSHWKRDGQKLAVAALVGARQKFTKSEIRKRWRQRRKLLWKIDRELRERHLAARRAEGIRRGRRQGRAPTGSALDRQRKSEAVKRSAAERRARQGPVMSGDELRARRFALGLTLADIARGAGVGRAAVCRWQRGEHGIPARVVEWLCALDEPAKRSEAIEDAGAARVGRTAPASAVMIGSGTHA